MKTANAEGAVLSGGCTPAAPEIARACGVPESKTPLEILIAIHHQTTNGLREFKPAAPLVGKIEERMRAAGLLRLRQVREPGMSSYEPTDGLRVYLEALRAVPWTVQVLPMPQREEPASTLESWIDSIDGLITDVEQGYGDPHTLWHAKQALAEMIASQNTAPAQENHEVAP